MRAAISYQLSAVSPILPVVNDIWCCPDCGLPVFIDDDHHCGDAIGEMLPETAE